MIVSSKIRKTYPALKILFKEAIDDVMKKKSFFKFKRIDQAIEASLNIEETFGDEPAEIDRNKPKRAKVSGNFRKNEPTEVDGNSPKRAKVTGNFSKKYVK